MALPGPTADYGIDAPPIVGGTFVAGFVLFMLGVFMAGGGAGYLSAVPVLAGAALLAAVAASIYTSKVGKARLWAEVLDGLDLRGDEHALDVGCGRGLVMIALAHRLPAGRVEGIDIWRSKDQSGNQRIVTESNAAIEGVADRIAVHDADMRSLPFPDSTFDLVTAGFSLHNVADPAGRATALNEMTRVIRPGGHIIIADIAKVAEYERWLREHTFDVAVSRRGGCFPPVRVLIATRSSAG